MYVRLAVRGDEPDKRIGLVEMSFRALPFTLSASPSRRARKTGRIAERRRTGTRSLGLTPDRARQRHGNYVDNAADCRFIMTS